MSQKYFIITYGCQMNKSDSERTVSVLEKIGYERASRENEADLIVVNMCSVRQSAVDRIYGLSKKFRELKKENKNLKTILTGCVLKEDKIKFTKFFDLIFNIKDLANLPQKLAVPQISDRLFQRQNYLKIMPKYKTSFRAFIPIMTGCNNFCAYCVVPYTRGPEISRPAGEILGEIKSLIKKRFKEIWLLGQNVNSYNSKVESRKLRVVNFAKLLKMVDMTSGNFWIRFTSPHPKDFSDELIDVMAKCKKVTNYLNLPVQSGDDKILKKMNRPYTIKQYKNLIKKIRKKIPDITLSTDAIVGFPGETKKQFENTVKLFKEMKYDMAYIAQYSPRSGTVAAKSKDNVKSEEKERRWKILTRVLKETALSKNKECIGKIIEVLPENYKNGYLIGKSWSYKTVKFEGKKNLIGKFLKVKIIDAFPWGLKGVSK